MRPKHRASIRVPTRKTDGLWVVELTETVPGAKMTTRWTFLPKAKAISFAADLAAAKAKDGWEVETRWPTALPRI